MLYPLLMILITFGFVNLQFIFDTSETCRYIINGKEVTVRNDLWNITTFDQRFLFSLCKPLKTPNCDSKSLACIQNLKSSPHSVRNAGTQFEVVKFIVDDKETEVLQSIKGAPCTGGSYGTYTFLIHLDMSSQEGGMSMVTNETNCDFRVTIRPNVQPPCTVRVKGQLISLQDFRGQEILVNTSGRFFAVSLCGPAKSCGDKSVTACELGEKPKPIGSLSAQRISYSDDGLMVRSTVGVVKKEKLTTEIHINCNWNTKMSNARYIVPQPQGKKFKFRLESSSACIKLPMQCIVRDLDNFSYNLNDLYKVGSSWLVQKSRGILRINICGPMVLPSNNTCTEKHSQVCSIQPKKSINYGSILKQIVVEDDLLSASFISGDTCATNKSMLLTTTINFECAAAEKGPHFITDDNCALQIHWQTPKACPKLLSNGADCIISDKMGSRNLNGIHQKADTKHNIAKNSYLRFNLCGNLAEPCGTSSDVSVCLVHNQQNYVIGKTNKNLMSENGVISMELSGEQCVRNGNDRKVSIFFHCDLSAPAEGKSEVSVLEDACSYRINVSTPLACISQDKANCIVKHDANLYDLNPLVRSSNNYVVKDGEVEYILNVCNPIVNTGGVLCPLNAASCLRNVSQPGIKNRFYSLGQLGAPHIENNELVAKYRHGKFCLKTLDKIITTIKFKCSGVEKGPQLASKSDCSYEFIWMTPHACPKDLKTHVLRDCTHRDNSSGSLLDFKEIHAKSLEFNDKNGVKYLLDICSNKYSKIAPDGVSTTITAAMQLRREAGEYYMLYKLNEPCIEHDNMSLYVRLRLVCDNSLKDNYEYVGMENCTISFELHAKAICSLKEFDFRLSDYAFTSDLEEESLEKPSKIPSKNLQVQNCVVTNDVNATFNVSTIHPFKIKSFKNVSYSVGFGKSGSCKGFICRNSLQLSTGILCPYVEYSYVESMIKLKFPSTDLCGIGYFDTQLWLKCNASLESPYIEKEAECLNVLVYPTDSACHMLKFVKPKTNSISIIVGITVFLLVLIASSIGFVAWNRRKVSSCRNKERVPIYQRNCQL